MPTIRDSERARIIRGFSPCEMAMFIAYGGTLPPGIKAEQQSQERDRQLFWQQVADFAKEQEKQSTDHGRTEKTLRDNGRSGRRGRKAAGKAA